MITKTELDKLVKKYETTEFIGADPVQFIHTLKDKKDIELLGFISALFAFGSRKVFIEKLNTLYKIMGNEPLNYILNGDFSELKGFNYRFAKTEDVVSILSILKKLYSESKGLGELFEYGYNVDNTIKQTLTTVTDYFYSNTKNITQGFAFMLAQPQKGGAMKRLNMLLRWFVRKSSVDIGIWNFIKPSELLIPLDTHVANVSRKMGLLTRNANDFKSVIELTNNLKQFDPNDPVKYDFAMFGAGIEGLYKD